MKTHLVLALAATLLVVGAQTAQAYDFTIVNRAYSDGSGDVNYAVVHTKGALCQDVAVFDAAKGDPPLKYQASVRASTPEGCLISGVDMQYGTRGEWAKWTSYGDTFYGGFHGGTYTLAPSGAFGLSGLMICFRTQDADESPCYRND